jgi:hypothetical protein
VVYTPTGYEPSFRHTRLVASRCVKSTGFELVGNRLPDGAKTTRPSREGNGMARWPQLRRKAGSGAACPRPEETTL